MKRATLVCLSALGLLGGLALGCPTPGHAQQPAAPAAQAQPAAPVAVGRSGTSAGRADRRRRSYAACNRASHQRDLRGGKRRRFLIRCRLGYERPRQTQPGQVQPGQVQPGQVQPGQVQPGQVQPAPGQGAPAAAPAPGPRP